MPECPRQMLAGIASMATRDLLKAFAESWNGRGDPDVRFESVGGVHAVKRIQDGERFDIAVLEASALSGLAAVGRVHPGTVTPLLRSAAVIATRKGLAHPDVSSEESLQNAILQSRAIGYSTGPSGRAIEQLFARWGLTESVAPRLVRPPPGTSVASILASGEADLGFQQLSELIHADNVEIVGPMPPGLEIVTIFAGAVLANSSLAEEAREVLDFLASPALNELKRKHGLDPVL